MGAIVPGVRATRSRTLALLALGLLWAGTAALPRVAAVDASTERRLRRWLANRAGQEVLLVLDPTPQNGRLRVPASTRPGGGARVGEYRRRAHAEAIYADGKKRGWAIEASKLAAADRFDRLLLALHLAYWWATQLGLRAIRRGERRRLDRPDRRDLSVVRIGRTWLAERLDCPARRPPLPFRPTATGWAFTWLA